MSRVEEPTASPHALEPTDGPLTREKLQLAFRNRGMPLEAMRYDVTPTGLHNLVVHWDIPDVELAGWRVCLEGHVRRPLELGLEEIRAWPSRTVPVTLECAGNGRGWLMPRPVSLPWLGEAIGTAEWTGTPRARVRSLMIPPGIPDFFSRRRFADEGPVALAGRAWSGGGAIMRVEVCVDDRWSDAILGPDRGASAWRWWSFHWDATPGEHALLCRATDAAGNVQPLHAPWN